MTTATATRRKAKNTTGFTVPTSALSTALSCVSAAVPARSPKPILQNVLIADGAVHATDLELAITTPLEGATCDPILLPHARLTAIINASTGDEVTLTPDGSVCVIESGTGTWRLPMEDSKEYPPRGSNSSGKSIGRLPCDQFRALVGTVKFATDNESSRFALGGVLVEFKDGTMSFVATDGRRLCVASCEIDQSLDDSATLVPRRVIDVLYRLATTDDAIQLEADASSVYATIGGTTVTGRLVEGRFPRWRDAEPTREHLTPTLVQVGELVKACRMARICESEASRGVVWTFTDSGIFMQARSSEFGESSATCEIVEPGTACTVKLDPAFAIEWLQQLDPAETVQVEAESESTAVIFRAGDCRNVVMPMSRD